MSIKTTHLLLALLASSASQAEKTVTIQPGDTLIKLLNSEGFHGKFKDVYPQLEEIKDANAPRFKSANLDLIYPGEKLIIPTVPLPPKPEPEPEPEPEPDYVGNAKLGLSQTELVRESTTSVINQEVGLLEKDLLRTNENGQVEISLNDQSKYLLGPNSEFLVEQFQYSPSNSEKFIAKLNLLVGMIKITTGKIGKKKDDVYELNTPLVALGVRGTEYAVRYCQGDSCGDLVGTTAAVKEGAIVVNTSSGPVDIPAGKFAQVESANAEVRIADIPEGFFDPSFSPSDIKLSWIDKTKNFFGNLFK